MSDTINRFLQNTLDDIMCPDRFAIYVIDGRLEVNVSGPDMFYYNPKTEEIENHCHILSIDESKIDRKILKKIWNKKNNIVIKETEDQILKEQFRVTGHSKRVKPKTKELIAKYEQAMKSK